MDLKWDALCSAINRGDKDDGVVEAVRLVDGGETPLDVFLECIEPCLADLGERFGRLEVFLPELMMAAVVVEAIQAELAPRMEGDAAAIDRGRVVIATIFGDIHDIGKNIVSIMLKVNGFKVKDLGVSIPAQDLVAAAVDFDADIIAVSGLMMPSLPYIKDTIALVKENDRLVDSFRIMVGGGPVTPEWAESAGADGYADTAVGAVSEARRLMAFVAEDRGDV